MNAVARIEDAGEKLGGARKDEAPTGSAPTAAPLQDALLTLAELWPKPDFAADVLAGHLPAATGALFLVTYETLASEPPIKFWRWPEAFVIEAYREGVLFFRRAYESHRSLTHEVLSKEFDAFLDQRWIDHEQRDSAPYLCGRRRGHTTRHPLGPAMIGRLRRDCLADLGWPHDPDVRPTDSWGAMRLHKKLTPSLHFWKAVRGDGNGVLFLDEVDYPDQASAMAVAKQKFQAEVARRKSAPKKGGPRGKPPSRPKLGHPCERIGLPPRDTALAVTAESLMAAYGFRGVEFGNWVTQEERQGLLDATWDALHDFCALLGAPSSFASMDGRLGIAFGSRGRGFLGGAAHFEPGRWVLHITKVQGAGALAHELGHALDALLAVRNSMKTEHASDWAETEAQSRRKPAVSMRDSDSLAALYDLYHSLLEPRSRFLINALSLDRVKRPYWSQPTELFARLFEAWVVDRLATTGARNEFLVSGCEPTVTAADWGMEFNPYPVGDERRRIDLTMGRFAATLRGLWSHPGADVQPTAKEAADTIQIDRGGFGNPFRTSRSSDHRDPVHAYAAWLNRCPDLLRIAKRCLSGKQFAGGSLGGDAEARVLEEAIAGDAVSTDDPVLVFGSNLAGAHGRGCAAFARRWRGAVHGQGVGRAGRSYAIPTKDAALCTLPLPVILVEVERFLDHAEHEPGTAFDISALGCGLAGYRDDEMVPLFSDAPANCRLPYRWQRLLDPSLPARVIVAGSRTFGDKALLAAKLDALLANLGSAVLVSGGAQGADSLGEQYSVERGLDFIRVPAEWDRYGRAAGMIRNQHMSFLASHVVAFWDGESSGTRGMIEIAKADRLPLRVVRV